MSTKKKLITSLNVFYFTALVKHQFNPFPNKPCFVLVCCTSLLKTLWEKEKFLLGELPPIFIKFKIVVCKLFQFGRV